jgi:hypothetical protein
MFKHSGFWLRMTLICLKLYLILISLLTSHSLFPLHFTVWHTKLHLRYQHLFKKVFEAVVPGIETIKFCHVSRIEHLMPIMSCRHFGCLKQEVAMNQLMFTILTFHGTVLEEK